jgi:glutamate-1-semialdehyde 2,1-aminomutase
MPSLKGDRDAGLRARAAAVIPGGMWGHMNAARLPPGYPQYFSRAEGCRLWDVDGNEYLDFMCSYGPMVLGYNDPDVERAAAEQRRRGDILNGPSERLVELAELLVGTVAHADWAMLAKNGTDATTTCVTIARAGTGKRKILVANGSYHGAAPWCTPSLVGVTAEDRAHILQFEYNDPDSVQRAVRQAGDDLAAVLVSAFRHDVRKDQEMPSPGFAQAVRSACDRTGAALVLDDVRAGFRLDLGGSWEPLGVRPDLSAFSKAIANGYALAAVTGVDRFREAAQKVFVTGSFWCAAVPMAAAIATIGKLRDTGAIARMQAAGERFRNGLQAQAQGYGIGIRQTGPVQMPQILFDDDPDFAKGSLFTTEALKGGLFLHPWHNMFLSAAHTDEDIDAALAITDRAFAVLADRLG